MAFLDFRRLWGAPRKSVGPADSNSSSTRFVALPSSGSKKSASSIDCSCLVGDGNIILLFTSSEVGVGEWSMTIDPPSETRQRAASYLCLAELLNIPGINQILAVTKNAGGLFAAIAAADITGVPTALILPEDQAFLNDRSIDLLLAEALEKARITFSPSAPLSAFVQTNLGKRIWLLPTWIEPTGTQPEATESRNREILTWILNGLEDGFPSNDFLRQAERAPALASTVPYVDPKSPISIHWSIHPYFQALHRLSQTGYQPEFIVDVGASTGYWSHVASRIFPKSRFYLIEPLLERYQRLDKTIYSLHPEFITIGSAAGNTACEMELNVSPDLYSSSFLDGAELSRDRHWDRVRVPVRTLDEISSTFSITGRGLLKIDVQLGEHLVLEGATQFLKQVDVVCVELSLGRFAPTSKTLFEMMTNLHHLGFEYFDYAGSWRNAKTGRMIQQDTVFIRSSLAY